MSKNFVSNEDAYSLFEKVGGRLGLRPKTFTGTHDQWDQLTEPQQSEYEYVNFTDDYAAGSMIFKRTLAAGATTVTVEDPSITSEVMIDVYADVFGVAPTNESVSNGVLTLTFPAQQSAVNLKIVVSGNPDKGGHGGGGLLPKFYVHADTGTTVTATKDGTTATGEEIDTGFFSIDIPDYGEWLVTGVVSGSTTSTTVVVDTVKEYNVNFIDGKTVLPTDDVATLLMCIGIYDSQEITTIQDVIADTQVLSAVVGSHNAMDYMARSETWTIYICADENAMSLIGMTNYAARTLLEDGGVVWRDAIGKSAYRDYVLNLKVPIMTSDTTPSGEVKAATLHDGYHRYYAFDGNDNTIYVGNSLCFSKQSRNYDEWIEYNFGRPVRIYYMEAYLYNNYILYFPTGCVIKGSNDGTNYTVISDTLGTTTRDAKMTVRYPADYNIIRFAMIGSVYNDDPNNNAWFPYIREMQFYGREDV